VYVCVCVCVLYFSFLFIHQGMFRLFLIFAFVNNAEMNMGVQVPIHDPVFFFFNSFGSIEKGLLDYMIILFLIVLEISILFSIMTALIHTPTNLVQRFPFLHYPCQYLAFIF
jgi:hypothetical protein